MAGQKVIGESELSDFYDFYTDDYCNKLRRRTFAKNSTQQWENHPQKKSKSLFVWRFLFYLLLFPTIIAVGASIPVLQPVYQHTSEMLHIPSLTKYQPSEVEKDISRFLEKNIDFVESNLPVSINPGGVYGYNIVDPGLYSGSSSLFCCLCDDSGNIVQITLSEFGGSPYTIYGVAPKTDNTTANRLLEKHDYQMLSDGYWVSRDSECVVLHEDFNWILRYRNNADNDIQLRELIERDFQYSYPDSAGAYYLENGQILEYYHDSFAEFCYQYSKNTEYNRQSMGEKADGRYFLVPGDVIDVFENGMIKVICSDNEATQSAGKIWPMQGIADLTLRPEQSALVSKLNKDTKVVLFARLISSSYAEIFGPSFSMEDGITIQIDGIDQDIPLFSDAIPGIQHYQMENGAAIPVPGRNASLPQKENSSYETMPIPSVSPTMVPQVAEYDLGRAYDALLDVLQNRTPFLFRERVEYFLLCDIVSAQEYQFDYPLTPTQYA